MTYPLRFARIWGIAWMIAMAAAGTARAGGATGPALVVHDGTGGIEADVVATVSVALAAAGYTVVSNPGLPGGDLSGNGQIWDLRFNNTTPLSLPEAFAYRDYLASGGSLFLLGENSAFVTRDTSLLEFVEVIGGPVLTLATPDDAQSVLAPFTGPNPLSSITYLAGAGLAGPLGGGDFITKDANGIGAAVLFGPGSLPDAAAGALILVFDVNFLQGGADADSHALTANLISYLVAPPLPTTTTTSTTTTTTETTSTTTLPAGCLAVPDGATFASIPCRLQELRDATAAAAVLAALQPTLDRFLAKALDRNQAARGFCSGNKLPPSKAQLNKVKSLVTQYGHALRSRGAKVAPPELIASLAGAADAIKANAKTLRGALQCPANAG